MFALHPLYLSLDVLSDSPPPEIALEIQTARRELDLQDVDYDGSMAAKTRIARKLFQLEGDSLMQVSCTAGCTLVERMLHQPPHLRYVMQRLTLVTTCGEYNSASLHVFDQGLNHVPMLSSRILVLRNLTPLLSLRAVARLPAVVPGQRGVAAAVCRLLLPARPLRHRRALAVGVPQPSDYEGGNREPRSHKMRCSGADR